MRKSLFIILCLVVTAITVMAAFTGCSSSSSTTTTSVAPSTTTSAPTTPVSTETIKIGMVSAYSGPMAAVAPYWLNGVQMAIDEANAAGGAMGRKFELVSRDDQTDPSVAVQKANELKAAGCVAIVGSLMESSDEALHNWAKDNHIPLMVSQSPGITLRTKDFNKYSFFPCPISSAWSKVAAKTISKMDKVKSVYFMGGDQTIAHELHDNFWTEINKIKPGVTDLGFTLLPFSEMDFANTISTILAKKPDILITIMGGPPWAAFVNQAQQFNLFNQVQVFAWGGLAPDNTAPFGKNFPLGVMGMNDCPYYLSDKPMQDFTKAYFASASLYPADITLPFYMGTKAFIQAIINAKSTDADAIVQALETGSFDTPVGAVSYDAYDHQAKMPIWVATSGYSADFPIVVGLNPVKYLDGLYPTQDEILAARAGK